MSNPYSREIETLGVLIQYKSLTQQGEEWPVAALIYVLGILDDYFEFIEEGEGESNPDYAVACLDDIFDSIHSIIVHETIPMTEEERTALEDQEVAAFRDMLENAAKEQGVDIKIVDLDQQLKNIQDSKYKGTEDNKEEEADDHDKG